MNKLSAFLAASLVLGACTTIGSGSGTLGADNQPVNFSWKSDYSDTSGTMSATLADGKVFSGPHVQATDRPAATISRQSGTTEITAGRTGPGPAPACR